MSNLPLIIVICALLSILPSGVVFMVLWGRLMLHDNRISSQLGVKEDIIAVQNKNKELIIRIEELDAAICSLDDRMKTYNNRLTAQQRHEKEKEREPEYDEEPEQKQIPVLDFPKNINNQTEQPQKRYTLTRKQG